MTLLIRRASHGELAARDELLERAYPEMRRLAHAFLSRHGAGFPETATVMVNRVCERLLSRESLSANDRKHFFRIFGRMMHDILIDELRARNAIKRSGNHKRVDMTEEVAAPAGELFDLVDLREAMEALRLHDADAAEVVNLRFFCGQTLEQAAETLECTFSTVRQHGDYGIAWLRARLSR